MRSISITKTSTKWVFCGVSICEITKWNLPWTKPKKTNQGLRQKRNKIPQFSLFQQQQQHNMFRIQPNVQIQGMQGLPMQGIQAMQNMGMQGLQQNKFLPIQPNNQQQMLAQQKGKVHYLSNEYSYKCVHFIYGNMTVSSNCHFFLNRCRSSNC